MVVFLLGIANDYIEIVGVST